MSEQEGPKKNTPFKEVVVGAGAAFAALVVVGGLGAEIYAIAGIYGTALLFVIAEDINKKQFWTTTGFFLMFAIVFFIGDVILSFFLGSSGDVHYWAYWTYGIFGMLLLLAIACDKKKRLPR